MQPMLAVPRVSGARVPVLIIGNAYLTRRPFPWLALL